MRLRSIGGAAVILGLLSACGGKVFVDLPESTGGGGSGGTGAAGTGAAGTMGTTASTGSGMTCDAMLAELSATIEAAKACNPAISSIQCGGSALGNDACSCIVVLNEKLPDAVSAAQSAYQKALVAGCLLDCEGPCPPSAPSFCQPSSDGTTGVCTVSLPD